MIRPAAYVTENVPAAAQRIKAFLSWPQKFSPRRMVSGMNPEAMQANEVLRFPLFYCAILVTAT